MTLSKTTPVEITSDRELVISRVFDAPRELIFKVWTDPDHIAQWWGPFGFTTTTQQMDLRPGGVWKHTMHGPDGTDYPNSSVFVEVAAPERLVYRHGGAKAGGPAVQFTATVTFEDLPGPGGRKTRVTMRQVYPTAAARDETVRAYGADEGGRQHLNRLAEYLRTTSGAAIPRDPREFSIVREFDAPRDLVYKSWTERDRLIRWFMPKGMTMTECTLDLRVGGVFHYRLRPPGGADFWGRWVFREIAPPERLVFIVSFSDTRRGITRHPMAPVWPCEMLSVVTFAERAGCTTVTVRWSAINATEPEREAFEDGRESMRQGWTGTLDHLEGFLAGA